MEDTAQNRKDRHKKTRCIFCGKCIRSDHVERHARTHKDVLVMTDEEVRDELRRRNALHTQKEEQRQRVTEIAQQENIPLYHCNDPQLHESASCETDIHSLETDLLKDNQDYLDKIELGRHIAMIIEKSVVNEESLSKRRKDALDLYQKQRSRGGITTQIELRPWQQELMDMIATPTERQVIWVQGIRGNEGKSWFQDYAASFFGYRRVVQLDLKMKTTNILHALAKRPLSSIDIFLFNEPRAMNIEVRNYGVLESIKDGIAVSAKYNSDVLHFKTPNVVIVFSNVLPSVTQLSRDRWSVLYITKGGLKNITDALWKKQTTSKPWNTYQKNSEDEHEKWIDEWTI